MTQPTPERKLWFDGPNYTADAVVIDHETTSILLIQRRDTGDWALPGGFVDADDTSALVAAQREALEEAAITLPETAPLIFRGIVDDPRNSDTAWIETSAYLFEVSFAPAVQAGDDARGAKWYSLANLPLLYASHEAIISRALEHLAHKHLTEVVQQPESSVIIDAGHMEYEKSVHRKNDAVVFAKKHDPRRFTDNERADRAYHYLEKEARTMTHLRQAGFSAIPQQSVLTTDALLMEALEEQDGWHWKAPTTQFDDYVASALTAFQQLEQSPQPADSFAIDPSYESLRLEGWQSLDRAMHTQLEQRLQQFAPRLTQAALTTATELLENIERLRHEALQPHSVERFVFCHHDIRQSNLAWHPEHGTKIIDWSWAGLGEPGSDSTSFLIDLAKAGHDISPYQEHINPAHCLTLIGFWLAHSTWPAHGDDTVRLQQFVSALSGYETLKLVRQQ